jgi:hypothetical protein
MEREVAEILGPVGVDDALSRRVAGALIKVEDDLRQTSQSTSQAPKAGTSWWRSALHSVARTPKTTDLEGDPTKLKWEEDVGLTTFLLKFGEVRYRYDWENLFATMLTVLFILRHREWKKYRTADCSSVHLR